MKRYIDSSLMAESRYIEYGSNLYRRLNRWIALLILSLALTLDSFVFGCAITFLNFIGAIDGKSQWSISGTLLIVAGFVFLMFVAHCMDRIDAAATAVRLQYCRENGLYFDELI